MACPTAIECMNGIEAMEVFLKLEALLEAVKKG
jgi:hypothetical protein